ncbi:hypothetical protein UDZ25_14235 [Serratia marcescens]|uniref:hypothetical protein n=1 Tax=Serratia marcescens TaxID=615 RepID=UPI0039BF4E09
MKNFVENQCIKTDKPLPMSYEALKAERDALAVENAALKSGCGFFAYDPDNGFEEFKTKDEAIAAAESYIDYYRGEACDGWPDEVDQVSWGIIMQESTRVNERPLDKDDSCDPAIETVCDYALLPNIETPATDAVLAAIEARAKVEAIEQLAIQLEQLPDEALEVLSDVAEFETYQEEHHTFVSISNPRAVANAVLSLVKERPTELREAK